MRYCTLGSYLIFIRTFRLTRDAEEALWFSYSRFESYPVAKVFCNGELFSWNDRLI